jgi:hypothetical protein
MTNWVSTLCGDDGAVDRTTLGTSSSTAHQKIIHSFCQAVAAKYPNTIKIRMVQDNLNTHDSSAFYENLPADAALALAERFEFYYTSKSASGLNMIEIEFSALSRQCLNRRIPIIEKLEQEILTLVAERTEQKIKIDW